MKTTEIAIVGGGPAGLCAAISAASSGAKVTVIERNSNLGGQLVKQTHMFFGSEKQYASTRGIDIPEILFKKLEEYKENIEIINNTNVVGLYEDGMITLMEDESKYYKIKPEAVIVATGASEKFLSFKNNDLPGIYGAGAVQTLMNVYGVRPGDKVLMVGAGNIGLIVSYQLMQAGVKVEAVIDAAPKIGGYHVHASKIRRMGIPILTRHTVVEAKGEEYLEKAVICELDEKWNPIEGTEKELDVDVMCISVGLAPLNELLSMVGCEMKYVPSLSGFVPMRYDNYETTVENIFTAGDSSGVEEASAAMVEGYLAGLCTAKKVGKVHENYDELLNDYKSQLNSLRSGPVGKHIRDGIDQIERRRDNA
ncbi:sarcosine oxidase subunit alpha [Dethiosulfatibacter aminovorans DSM 17477]|uniref:Sarcosine oxidase subunit alpha n=1 Tax=Dethiosulfatibacter aminovorans DSM 17477 TaxID=1121476 RepID=A0A1M6J522_9FIRM|nr:NAD(P)/FAD-dependent oxidoreductase [Dethiosulfatibacter aminovorans]SHJ41729.1 sarcosine oxidase subunit alpha [Dethiosulfatibacter aminovorans DSM 17477]